MSKDVVIAGAIVAACLGLVTVAFVLPKHKTVKTDPVADLTTASTDPAPAPSTPSDPAPLPSDFGSPTQPGLPGQPLAINPPPSGGLLPLGGPTQPNGFNSTSPGFKSGGGIQPSFPQQPPVIIPDPTPIPPPAAAASEAKTHLVASGETLGEISMKYYGTSKNWKKIAEANKIGDPGDMHVGQKLTIPVIESAKPKEGAPTTETPALSAGEHVYKVRAGDSYYTIAKKELGNANRWKELEKLNNIPAEELHVGQSIKLPNKEAASGTAPTAIAPGAPEPAPTGNGRVHVVASGDTLADISKKYFGTTSKWKDIVKANPGVDPEGLKVGQKLNIPEGASVAPGGAVPGAPAPAETGEVGDYEVKPGDTLETIAQSQLGNKKDWKKIVDANPGLDAKHMRIKQKLKIPGKTKPAESNAPIPAPVQPPSFGSPAGFGNPNGGLSNPNGGGFGNPNNGFSNPNGLGPSPAYPTPGSTNPAPGNNGFSAPPPSPAYPSPSAPPALPPSTAPLGAPPTRGGANGIPP